MSAFVFLSIPVLTETVRQLEVSISKFEALAAARTEEDAGIIYDSYDHIAELVDTLIALGDDGKVATDFVKRTENAITEGWPALVDRQLFLFQDLVARSRRRARRADLESRRIACQHRLRKQLCARRVLNRAGGSLIMESILMDAQIRKAEKEMEEI